MEELTFEQKIIISGYTGVLCIESEAFVADVKKRLGRDINPEVDVVEDIMALYESDFFTIIGANDKV